MTRRPACWCGADGLQGFSPAYHRCAECDTLVSATAPDPDIARVTDEERDFYGRRYWFEHQEAALGLPNIVARARTDLPERCVHWLRAALRYKLPPARALEVGSGHGGFVALLGWAGFEATGLELSPWVVRSAREMFHVPMLQGPVEDQRVAPGSLDLVALLDVLEHLPDPAGTMRTCLELLKPDGVLMIQTPCYSEGRRHEDMLAGGDRFLGELRAPDHLYLFSRRALRELFRRLGAEHVAFEPAIFAEYDMFAFVSRAPLAVHEPTLAEQALSARPAGRLVQALLDLAAQLEGMGQRLGDSEADRAARFDVIQAQGRRLGEVQGECNTLQAEVAALRAQRDLIEADRAARLAVIREQGARLGEVEGERNTLQAEVAALRAQRDPIEADRAARLAVIREQGTRLGEMEAERDALRAQVEAQQYEVRALVSQLRGVQEELVTARSGRAYRLLRWLRMA